MSTLGNPQFDIELSAFFESSTDDEDIEPIQAVSYCNLVVLSTTLRHQDILAARFEDHF